MAEKMLSVPEDEYKLLHRIAYSAAFAHSDSILKDIHADMLPPLLAQMAAIDAAREQRLRAALGAH